MEVTSAEQALHSLEIAELPIANPLRCFRMFGDSCSEARRAKWCGGRFRLRTELLGCGGKVPSLLPLSRSLAFSG
jgi:hypothetical protein